MSTITITKENAEFIKKTATKEIKTKNNWERTFYLPVFYKMTEVMIDSNVVTGQYKGEWIEYDVEFSEEAKEILEIF